MASKFITANLAQVLAARSAPGVTLWNRLEGRPRAERFDRALRAEVRDALWMLAKQWQVGEFRGDDAGSPILAKARIETTRLSRYRAAQGPVEPVDAAAPLEAIVERMPLALTQGGQEIALEVRLLLGRQWQKLIGSVAAATLPAFITRYPIHVPDPTSPDDAGTCAHPEAWSAFAAVAGRRIDGAKLYAYLKASATHRASDGIAGVGTAKGEVDLRGDRFVRWVDRLFTQPAGDSAWVPERLEYAFSASAPESAQEKVLACDEYFRGRIDWYNFDVDAAATTLGAGAAASEPPTRMTLTMLPTLATFPGMPNSRWWAFEDGRTNFGAVSPDTTDLGKLMLLEYALVYSNDWLVVPCTVAAGSLVDVRGLAVTNVFGERLWIEAAGRGDDDDWQRWAMFTLSTKGSGHESADQGLLLPPAAQGILTGAPLEAAAVIRDEVANMVWAVEQTITLPSGAAKSGREAAFETRAYFERDLARRLGAPPQDPPLAEGALIRYQVMNSVPENWIPLIPVHVQGSNRETQLQRAAMPRVLAGDPDPPKPVRPRTSLLRQGLDGAAAAAYLIHEEEVPRAGIRVAVTFRRARGRDGRVWLWLGAQKQTGRGEGSSGLAFDRIADAAP